MKIANKQDSFNQIKKLGLNRVPEIIATKNDRQKVEEFFNKYKAPVYVLRDVKHAMGKTYFIHDKNECFKHIDEYNDFFHLPFQLNPIRAECLQATYIFLATMSNSPIQSTQKQQPAHLINPSFQRLTTTVFGKCQDSATLLNT